MAGATWLAPRIRGNTIGARGDVAFSQNTGTAITLSVVNPTPAGPGDEDPAGGLHQADRGILAFSRPNVPSAGPGIYTWINRVIGVLSSPPNFTTDFTVTLQRDFGTDDFGRHTGLYFVRGVSGKRYVCGIANATTPGNMVLVRLDLDTRIWTQHEVVTSFGSALSGLCSGLVWHGMLWASSDGRVVGIDPDNPESNHQEFTFGTAGYGNLSRLFVAYDRLLVVARNATNMEIWENFGAAFVRLTLPAAMPDASGSGQFTLLATAGEVQIVYPAITGPNNGFRHFAFAMNSTTKWDVGTGGEFTGLTIPDEGTGGAGAWPDSSLRWSFFEVPGVPDRSGGYAGGLQLNEQPWTGLLSHIVMRLTDPETAVTADVFAAGGLGGFWTPITATVPPIPGVTSPPFPQEVVWPTGNLWGSTEHCSLPGDNQIVQLLSHEQIPGENRFRLRFWIVAAGVTTGRHVAFFYLDPTQPSTGMVCLRRCTLIGPVVGVDRFATPAVLSGLKVIDCTAENNGDLVNPPAIYEVTWDADADGFPPNTWGRIMGIPMPTFIP